MTVIDWADLTEQQLAMMLAPRPRSIDVAAQLVNFDLTPGSPVNIDPTSGSINWDGSATVHRDISCTLVLDTELPWGISELQIIKTYTDKITGLSARRSRGVFALTAPDKPLGAKILNPTTLAYSRIPYQVTGQDGLYWLNRQIGYSYWLEAGLTVLTLARQSLIDAGIPSSRILIDGTRAAATLPQDAVFAWISNGSAGDVGSATPTGQTTSTGDPNLADAANPSGPYTWLQVVNYLMQLIGYRGVWCDTNGFYRLAPYIDPAVATPLHTFDATSPLSDVTMAGRVISRNRWAPPNQWTAVWSNLPDVGGVAQVPTVANGGVVTLVNQSTGPSSIDARHGLVFPVQFDVTAATAADVAAAAAARKTADMRILTTYTYATRQFPQAEHFDVFTLRDTDIDGGQDQVQASTFKEPLGTGDTAWTLTSSSVAA